jgi:hypothetical protein
VATFLKKAIELVDRQIGFTEKQIFEAQKVYHCPFYREAAKQNTVQWTGSVSDFVELGYALHASGSIENGKITLTQLFQILGAVFDIDVKEFSRKFSDIKNRSKGDRTKFINRMKQALTELIEKADDRASRK